LKIVIEERAEMPWPGRKTATTKVRRSSKETARGGTSAGGPCLDSSPSLSAEAEEQDDSASYVCNFDDEAWKSEEGVSFAGPGGAFFPRASMVARP
jgi:hypothetical protein